MLSAAAMPGGNVALTVQAWPVATMPSAAPVLASTLCTRPSLSAAQTTPVAAVLGVETARTLDMLTADR